MRVNINVVVTLGLVVQDLMIRSLADRIHDCPQMSLLYPSIPKDQGGGPIAALHSVTLTTGNLKHIIQVLKLIALPQDHLHCP